VDGKTLAPGKIKLPPGVEVFSAAAGAAHTLVLTDQVRDCCGYSHTCMRENVNR
jgi:hypothetical protein